MNEQTLDLNEFLERVQDDKELLLELLDIFVNDYKEKSRLLNQAISQKDIEQVKGIAHSLKGAYGNISAKSMRKSLIIFEEMKDLAVSQLHASRNGA